MSEQKTSDLREAGSSSTTNAAHAFSLALGSAVCLILQEDSVLTESARTQLLLECCVTTEEGGACRPMPPNLEDLPDACALPKRPYVNLLIARLTAWAVDGKYPLKRVVLKGLENSMQSGNQATQSECGALLRSIFEESATHGAEDAKALMDSVRQVLSLLDVRGVLTLLGLQHTLGSVNRFPPCVHALVASFNYLHAYVRDPGLLLENKAPPPPPTPVRIVTASGEVREYIPKIKKKGISKLTVGARALAKHCGRTQESKDFWGVVAGGEAKRNSMANAKLATILSRAEWLNCHMLPHELAVFEIRVSERYGARWSVDGHEFRGFLEPDNPYATAVATAVANTTTAVTTAVASTATATAEEDSQTDTSVMGSL